MKKLTLDKETIRELSSADLRTLVGGAAATRGVGAEADLIPGSIRPTWDGSCNKDGRPTRPGDICHLVMHTFRC